MAKYVLSSWVFQRLMGLVYFAAFASWINQIPGLYGPNGLLPVAAFLEQHKQSDSISINFSHLPTLLWIHEWLDFEPSVFLQLITILGSILSLLFFVGLNSSIIAATLWILYASLVAVGQTFSSFQWDILLLESGFILIFYCPLIPKPLHKLQNRDSPPDSIQWLFRWLLFRLMFSSGVVKLLSQGQTWWDLSATTVHYETQCIPNPIAWYMHQIPLLFQQISVAIMFIIEIIFPFFTFVPTPLLRNINGISQIILQLLIIFTGNYNYFNWLTIALSITLLDDETIFRYLFPKYFNNMNRKYSTSTPVAWRVLDITVRVSTFFIIMDLWFLQWYSAWHATHLMKFMDIAVPLSLYCGLVWTVIYVFKHLFRTGFSPVNLAKFIFISSVTFGLFSISTVPYVSRIHRNSLQHIPSWVLGYHQKTNAYHLSSSYGLFASMTTWRDEIILEGSFDGKKWTPYEFPYKPGNTSRAPPFVAPHQPRLDWQMWFAALGNYQRNPWYVMLVYRLLQGSPDVLALMDSDPFEDKPPSLIRSRLFNFKFTSFENCCNENKTRYWKKTYKSDYLPIMDLNNTSLLQFAKQFETKKWSESWKHQEYFVDYQTVHVGWVSVFAIFVCSCILVWWNFRQIKMKQKRE